MIWSYGALRSRIFECLSRMDAAQISKATDTEHRVQYLSSSLTTTSPNYISFFFAFVPLTIYNPLSVVFCILYFSSTALLELFIN